MTARRRVVRKLLVIVGVAALVAVLGIASVPLWFDADRFRPDVERHVAEMLGREVSLGTLSAAFGLGVVVETPSLEIGPPLRPTGEPGPTVEAGDVRIRLGWVRLLFGDVYVRHVGFERGVVRQGDGALATDLEFAGEFDRPEDGVTRLVGRLVGRADVFGNARLDTRFDVRLAGDRLDLDRFDADVGPATLDVGGAVTGFESGELAADLDVRGTYGTTAASGTLAATFAADGTRLAFELDADPLDLDEIARLAGWTEEPPATATAVVPASSSFWFPAAHAADAADAAPAAEPDRASASADPTAPASVDLSARGVLRAARGRVGGIAFDGLSARLTYARGEARFEDVRFGVHGGKHDGAFSARLEEPTIPFRLTDRIAGVDVGALLAEAAPTLAGVLHGTGSFTLDVTGEAATEGAVAGTGSIEILDGRITGTRLLEEVTARLARRGVDGGAADETPFERMSSSFRLRNRVAETDDLRFRSRDLDLDGRGTVTLDGALDLDVLARLSGEVTEGVVRSVRELRYRVDAQGRMSVPVRVEGTLAEPEIGIDLEALLRDGLEETLKEGLRGLFRKRDR